MASASQQASPAVALQVTPSVVDPNMVGNAFVLQYYHILFSNPEVLHRFYQNISKIGRPGLDEKMLVTSTLPEAVKDKMLTNAYGDFRAAEILTVDSQESHNGGVLVVVTGYFPFHEKAKTKFNQTFFLAPQEKGYFVLNDIFRFVDEPKTDDDDDDGDIVVGKASETSTTPSLVPAEGDNASEEPASTLVNPGDEEVCKSLDNENAPVVEEKTPVPEIINEVVELEITTKEVEDDSQKLSEQDNGPQDVPKISYASVISGQTVMKEKTGVLAAPSPPPKPVSEDQDQQVASDTPVVKSQSVLEAFNVIENVDNQHSEVAVEGASIYVKGLPLNATPALLENEFKQFGTIRSNGIQVKNQRRFGFGFGFVEFEESVAAQKAIEASPVIIGGRKTIIEEKRSTSRGNRERAFSGPGNVYRSEEMRGGRGGRWYGRCEYGSRGYNNRGGGGYSNRRGNMYHRTESGGRVHRGAHVALDNNISKTLV